MEPKAEWSQRETSIQENLGMLRAELEDYALQSAERGVSRQ